MNHSLHVKKTKEEEQFQRLSKEMVDLHEEWAEIDANQEALHRNEAAPPVLEKRHFKRTVTMNEQTRLAKARAKQAAFFAPKPNPTL